MTFTAPHIDYAGLSPVIALTAGICVVLIGGLIGPRRQRAVVSILSLATLAIAAGLCIWQWGQREDLVSGALRLDELGLAVALIAIFAAAFCIPLSWREEATERPGAEPRHGEFQALLLGSVLGMALLGQAQNLVAFFVGLELLSVPLYVLCGSALGRRRSREPGSPSRRRSPRSTSGRRTSTRVPRHPSPRSWRWRPRPRRSRYSCASSRLRSGLRPITGSRPWRCSPPCRSRSETSAPSARTR